MQVWFLVKYNYMLESNIAEIYENDFNAILDIVYATKNNFANVQIYKKPRCFLHKDAIDKLKIASKIANDLGFKFRIYDCFRPLEAQRILFNLFPRTNYVSDPDTGLSSHTRGIAIDLGLIDIKTNKDLDFGTKFDDFEVKAHQDYLDLTREQSLNRCILSGIMSRSGFVLFMDEWWHFQLPNAEKYPKLTQKNINIDLVVDDLIK